MVPQQESLIAATAIIRDFSLGLPVDSTKLSLPGPDNAAKQAFERELRCLQVRMHAKSAFAPANVNGNTLPATPADSPSDTDPGGPTGPLQPATRKELAHASVTELPVETLRPRSGTQNADARVSRFLAASEDDEEGRQISGEDLAHIRAFVQKQAEEIQSQRQILGSISRQVKDQQTYVHQTLEAAENTEFSNLLRELTKEQQANRAFKQALEEISSVITNVAQGDLSQTVPINKVEFDSEITSFKETINRMVGQLQEFGSEVSRVAREVGTEGKLGGQAQILGVSGIWAELTQNVNVMAENLTLQVREIADVTSAVAAGDLSKNIQRPAQGEILQLQGTLNQMVHQLRTFATEVTRVSRDVGTEGILGGQAVVEGGGMWSELTVNVNRMASSLTDQVRDIAKVTTAVARGDLTQKVQASCKGEILELKETVNTMVDQLRQFAQEVTKISVEVGLEGKLGGQAVVHDVQGTWLDLTKSLNFMASTLTTQVREIASVTSAIANGDLSIKIKSDAKGEISAMKTTINDMVSQTGVFPYTFLYIQLMCFSGRPTQQLLLRSQQGRARDRSRW